MVHLSNRIFLRIPVLVSLGDLKMGDNLDLSTCLFTYCIVDAHVGVERMIFH